VTVHGSKANTLERKTIVLIDEPTKRHRCPSNNRQRTHQLYNIVAFSVAWTWLVVSRDEGCVLEVPR
jgi:hypothetical protein